MTNPRKFIGPGMLVVGVSCFIALVFIMRSVDYSDAKTEADCKNVKTTGNQCPIWDGSNCRKGKKTADGKSCEADGTILPVLFLALGVVLIVGGIGVTIYEWKK